MVKEIYRNHYAKIFSSLYSRYSNLDLVEDAIHTAFEKLLNIKDGQKPKDPAAWLYVVARNYIIDDYRRQKRQIEYVDEISREEDGSKLDRKPDMLEHNPKEDKRLNLLLLCCHPAIKAEAQILLTLKLFAGLSTKEISTLLLKKVETVQQVIVRAKRKIKLAKIPFEMEDMSRLDTRLNQVFQIIYLIATEAHQNNSEFQKVKRNLVDLSLHLAEVITHLCPENPEALSLYALVLFNNARLDARINDRDEFLPISLEQQDWSRWNKRYIESANLLMDQVIELQNEAGFYYLQAAISGAYANS